MASIPCFSILAASLWETGAEMEAEISEEDEGPAVAAALAAAQTLAAAWWADMDPPAG